MKSGWLVLQKEMDLCVKSSSGWRYLLVATLLFQLYLLLQSTSLFHPLGLIPGRCGWWVASQSLWNPCSVWRAVEVELYKALNNTTVTATLARVLLTMAERHEHEQWTLSTLDDLKVPLNFESDNSSMLCYSFDDSARCRKKNIPRNTNIGQGDSVKSETGAAA